MLPEQSIRGTFFNCNNNSDTTNYFDISLKYIRVSQCAYGVEGKGNGGSGYKECPYHHQSHQNPLVCSCNENTGINCTSNEVIEDNISRTVIYISLATVGLCGGVSPGCY